MPALNQKSLRYAQPEEVGFSTHRLARIRPGMQRYIDEGKVPHIITLVARQGKIVHCEAQGYLDLQSRRPASKDTIVRLYSNSKPVAGVAIMILYEEGLLDLDDPVSKYIPTFKNPVIMPVGNGTPDPITPIPARREITIRDCLRNTTGLATPQRSPAALITLYPDDVANSGWDLNASINVPPAHGFRSRIEAHARLPLAFQPGTDFEYHVGYLAIGAIIEQITCQTLEEFYQSRIFKPLGMRDTSFYLDKKKLSRFPVCYESCCSQGKWTIAVLDPPETSEKFTGPRRYFAAGGDMGGILSTVFDYARFGQMLLNGGELDGARVLSRKTVELMTTSHTGSIYVPMSGAGFGFGMGVGVYNGGNSRPSLRSVGTYGWGGAAGTVWFADPKEKLQAICFTQVLHARDIPGNTYQEEFEKLVYQALL